MTTILSDYEWCYYVLQSWNIPHPTPSHSMTWQTTSLSQHAVEHLLMLVAQWHVGLLLAFLVCLPSLVLHKKLNRCFERMRSAPQYALRASSIFCFPWAGHNRDGDRDRDRDRGRTDAGDYPTIHQYACPVPSIIAVVVGGYQSLRPCSVTEGLKGVCLYMREKRGEEGEGKRKRKGKRRREIFSTFPDPNKNFKNTEKTKENNWWVFFIQRNTNGL